ncbi:cytochrome c biogenesis protein CcsA [Cytophagaceae bacterium ABcell3]|nr:cytochrome c biogenesis protein CcsA [Cytophagaceae bacterium ABcell3]
MDYIGEHTFLGTYGHFFVVLCFVSTLVAALGYYLAIDKPLKESIGWKQFADKFFLLHGISLLVVIGILFYMIFSHYFEYHYVWKYSNLSMPWHYLLSSFWSGQEGSFLLWSFWILILSFLLKPKFGQLESPVLMVVSTVQAFIFTMLLGVYIGDVKIGGSPFLLIRELPENAGMPWTEMSDYMLKVEALQDGTGLNPLLQNYWMVIHPPVLFLGFAATLFPFALAVAGAIVDNTRIWIQPAITCGLFAMLTLGAGILLGGAWAYESLSFGGFWAWDPVENASLVPWVLLTAGVHMLFVAKKRNKFFFLSRLLVISAFIFVLYSSFLTRSGVLGDSSVHSFTENGLLVHLFLFLFSFALLGLGSLIGSTVLRWIFVCFSFCLLFLSFYVESHGFLVVSWIAGVIFLLVYAFEKQKVDSGVEDKVLSREFWILTGTLVMVTASLQITLSTSVPLINKLFGTDLDAYTDLQQRNMYYAMWQVPFGTILCLLIGVSQFLKYKNTNFKLFIKNITTSLLLALLFSVIIAYLISYDFLTDIWYLLLMFASFFAVFSNFAFLKSIYRGSRDYWGGSVAHIGFGMLVAGALISASGKTAISNNQNEVNLQVLDENFLNTENVMLYKGDTVPMGEYFVSYQGKHQEGVNLYYEIDYFDKEVDDSLPGEHLFSLSPFIQLNEKFGNVSEPGTKHFVSHDVFTHIKWADVPMNTDGQGEDDDFMDPVFLNMEMGKKYQHENHLITFEDIYLLGVEEKQADGYDSASLVVQAELLIRSMSDPHKDPVQVNPLYVVKDSAQVDPVKVYSEELRASFSIVELPSKPNTINLAIEDDEYLVLQALKFPGMNLLWAGCIIMVVGCFMAFRKNMKEKGAEKVVNDNQDSPKDVVVLDSSV